MDNMAPGNCWWFKKSRYPRGQYIFDKVSINSYYVFNLSAYSSQNHTLSIRGNNFKFYENQDGYIIKGPTIKMLYLSIEGVQEETKKAIKKHKSFDVAFFFMKKLEWAYFQRSPELKVLENSPIMPIL